MIDARIVRRLSEDRVASCLIGAAALAVHGYARYSADVDVLVADRRVLSHEFWRGCDAPEIRIGIAEDPLIGVVRWSGQPATDVVVNDDYACRYALRTAAPAENLPVVVPSPVGLVLTKLEAGSPLDAHDVVAFVRVQQALRAAGWLGELDAEVAHLRAEARALWGRLSAELGLRSP